MITKRTLACLFLCQITALFMGLNAANAQTRVSTIDIGEVFKNHPSFSQQLTELRTEAEQFKQSSLQLRQQMMKKAEGLRQYEPGSADFQREEAALAKESAALEVQQRNKMRTLMKREAELHFATYQQVEKAIANYCEPREIQLVLRRNNVEMIADNPASIMQRVNGQIVFVQPSRDITAAIVAELPKVTR